MKRFTLLSCAVLGFAVACSSASAQGPRGGFIGFGYGPWGYYDPAFGMSPYYSAAVSPAVGAIKLDTHLKDAEVFVNGSYAGTVSKLRTMLVTPGNYTVELRAAGHESYKRDIFVSAGKTIKLSPELRAL